MPRSRPFSELLPLRNIIPEGAALPQSSNPSPFDVKKEYSDLMSFMNEKRLEESETYYAKLPYKLGYILLLFIVLTLMANSTMSAYNEIRKRDIELEAESDACLVQFSSKKCDVATPSD